MFIFVRKAFNPGLGPAIWHRVTHISPVTEEETGVQGLVQRHSDMCQHVDVRMWRSTINHVISRQLPLPPELQS